MRSIDGRSPVLLYAHGHAFVFAFGLQNPSGGLCSTCGDHYPDVERVSDKGDVQLVFHTCPRPTEIPSATKGNARRR